MIAHNQPIVASSHACVPSLGPSSTRRIPGGAIRVRAPRGAAGAAARPGTVRLAAPVDAPVDAPVSWDRTRGRTVEEDRAGESPA
ncbi:hypothetical protein SLA_1370 [Streptomyces laurentii]|uniref:Uncharacterized protein n=1 Tax=Streptomyces laurentii TaxID=39478 RepID=A0A160NUR5_STRLU|nr:hypothetical protein SLA_1370 [Streptomyces laurentii]